MFVSWSTTLPQENYHSCSPHLEHLTMMCHPFYLPREFTSVITTAVYIHPQADLLSVYQNKHSDAALIVAGDFNKPTWGRSCQTFINMSPVQLEGQTHWTTAILSLANIFLMLKYKQRLIQEALERRMVQRWSAYLEAAWQHALDDVDWDMFRSSFADINEFTNVAIIFVRMLIEDTTHTVTIRTFSNQKQWIIPEPHVNIRTAVYNTGPVSGNMSEYKVSCCAPWCTVKADKLQYREWVEFHFQLNDSQCMWQGLRTISVFWGKSTSLVSAVSSMADELNMFYVRFKANYASISLLTSITGSRSVCNESVITISKDEVWMALKYVNIRKVAGTDCTSGHVLRSYADQLACLFTSSIFTESLAECVVHTCFKKSAVILVPKNNKPSCLNLNIIYHEGFWEAYQKQKHMFLHPRHHRLQLIPHRLASKLRNLTLNAPLCDWVLDFLTCRPQGVRVGQLISNTIILRTRAPQHPVLLSLHLWLCALSQLRKILDWWLNVAVVLELWT